MALTRGYPDDFERLWKAYPKWPTGRSKKEPSFKAFSNAKKILQFDQEDIEFILADIEERKRYCETWQKGNKFGPEMFSTYFNQHRWNETYQRIRGADQPQRETAVVMTEEDNKRMWAIGEYRAGRPVPESYQKYLEGMH